MLSKHRRIRNLSNKVSMVVCGKKHSIATCLNGKELYIWGNNTHRQLGLFKKNYIKRPKKLMLGNNKNKILTNCADNKSSFFLMSNLSTKDINIYVMSDSKKLLLNKETNIGKSIDQNMRGLLNRVNHCVLTPLPQSITQSG